MVKLPSYITEYRDHLVECALNPDTNIKELCAQNGISATTLYKWIGETKLRKSREWKESKNV